MAPFRAQLRLCGSGRPPPCKLSSPLCLHSSSLRRQTSQSCCRAFLQSKAARQQAAETEQRARSSEVPTPQLQPTPGHRRRKPTRAAVELTADILACTSAAELLAVYSRCGPFFTTYHARTALLRLAELNPVEDTRAVSPSSVNPAVRTSANLPSRPGCYPAPSQHPNQQTGRLIVRQGLEATAHPPGPSVFPARGVPGGQDPNEARRNSNYEASTSTAQPPRPTDPILPAGRRKQGSQQQQQPQGQGQQQQLQQQHRIASDGDGRQPPPTPVPPDANAAATAAPVIHRFCSPRRMEQMLSGLTATLCRDYRDFNGEGVAAVAGALARLGHKDVELLGHLARQSRWLLEKQQQLVQQHLQQQQQQQQAEGIGKDLRQQGQEMGPDRGRAGQAQHGAGGSASHGIVARASASDGAITGVTGAATKGGADRAPHGVPAGAAPSTGQLKQDAESRGQALSRSQEQGPQPQRGQRRRKRGGEEACADQAQEQRQPQQQAQPSIPPGRPEGRVDRISQEPGAQDPTQPPGPRKQEPQPTGNAQQRQQQQHPPSQPPQPPQPEAHPQWAPLPGHLRPLITLHEVLQLAAAFASLHYWPSPAWLQVVEPATLPVLPACAHPSTSKLPALLRNLAQSGAQPSAPWLQAACAATQPYLASYRAEQLSNLLSNLTGLGHSPDGAWAAEFLAASERQLPGCAAEGLVAVISSLAKLGCRPGEGWMQRFYGALAARVGAVGGLTGPQAATVLSSLTALDCRPTGEWLNAILMGTRRSLLDASVQHLTDLASSLARLRFRPPEPWLQQYITASFQRLPFHTPQQCCIVAASVARLGRRPQSLWVQEIGRQLGTNLALMTGGQQSQAVAALAELGYAPTPAWLRVYEQQSNAQLAACSAAELCRGLAAVTKMGFRPNASWLYSFIMAAYSRLDSFDGPQLTLVFDCLPALTPHGSWVDEIIQICAAETSMKQSVKPQEQQQHQPQERAQEGEQQQQGAAAAVGAVGIGQAAGDAVERRWQQLSVSITPEVAMQHEGRVHESALQQQRGLERGQEHPGVATGAAAAPQPTRGTGLWQDGKIGSLQGGSKQQQQQQVSVALGWGAPQIPVTEVLRQLPQRQQPDGSTAAAAAGPGPAVAGTAAESTTSTAGTHAAAWSAAPGTAEAGSVGTGLDTSGVAAGLLPSAVSAQEPAVAEGGVVTGEGLAEVAGVAGPVMAGEEAPTASAGVTVAIGEDELVLACTATDMPSACADAVAAADVTAADGLAGSLAAAASTSAACGSSDIASSADARPVPQEPQLAAAASEIAANGIGTGCSRNGTTIVLSPEAIPATGDILSLGAPVGGGLLSARPLVIGGDRDGVRQSGGNGGVMYGMVDAGANGATVVAPEPTVLVVPVTVAAETMTAVAAVAAGPEGGAPTPNGDRLNGSSGGASSDSSPSSARANNGSNGRGPGGPSGGGSGGGGGGGSSNGSSNGGSGGSSSSIPTPPRPLSPGIGSSNGRTGDIAVLPRPTRARVPVAAAAAISSSSSSSNPSPAQPGGAPTPNGIPLRPPALATSASLVPYGAHAARRVEVATAAAAAPSTPQAPAPYNTTQTLANGGSATAAVAPAAATRELHPTLQVTASPGGVQRSMQSTGVDTITIVNNGTGAVAAVGTTESVVRDEDCHALQYLDSASLTRLIGQPDDPPRPDFSSCQRRKAQESSSYGIFQMGHVWSTEVDGYGDGGGVMPGQPMPAPSG